MDKLEITAAAKWLGTYETSIEPDADCCTLFTPRHPSTGASPHELARAESRLDLARLVRQGAEGAAVERFAFPRRGGAAAP
jgi:thiamine biosynthesis protein ThiI